MEIAVYIALVLAIIVLLLYFFLSKLKKQPLSQFAMGEESKQWLETYVPFYQQLDNEQRRSFESRVQSFLSQVRITGVNTIVEDLDKILIAASAVIPIFGFDNWEYDNLNEVLLYPGSFGNDFAQEGQHRNTLGMVGSGAMNNVMILSQHELRQSFINKTGKTNVAIHEFVHLIDKTDGSVDGFPAYFVDKQFALPWLQLIHRKIKEIMTDQSDINPYGATNEAEFFAVAAEYFFERPKLLSAKHPELFKLLTIIFRQVPSGGAK